MSLYLHNETSKWHRNYEENGTEYTVVIFIPLFATQFQFTNNKLYLRQS